MADLSNNIKMVHWGTRSHFQPQSKEELEGEQSNKLENREFIGNSEHQVGDIMSRKSVQYISQHSKNKTIDIGARS